MTKLRFWNSILFSWIYFKSKKKNHTLEKMTEEWFFKGIKTSIALLQKMGK